jgi:SAM-dependent methyltransferase
MELCCGTGTASVMLAQAGAEIFAMDICPDMLNIAEKKAAEAGLNITFLAGDLNRFDYGRSYDFVFSLCDGFNYLKPQGAESFLQKTFDALKKNGLLFFDLSTKYKAENILSDGVFFEDREELTYLYTTKYNAKKAYADREVIIFEHTGANNYIRSEEKGRQYFYDTEYIIALLKKIGFRVDFFDGDKLSTYKKNSQRLLVFAYKE